MTAASWADLEALVPEALPDEPGETTDAVDCTPTLPDELWDARRVLGHVRTAARARLVAPDALLGATLARVCVSVDWRIVLPPIVGRQGSLNLSVALAGRSGTGKGSVADESAALLGRRAVSVEHPAGEAPAGSGEGIIKSFFDLVADPDSDKKNPPKVWQLARRAMLLRIDEGELLRALGQRSGQTTDQVLRQAWSGEALGGSYVGESGQRSLDAHGYRLAVLLAVQPEVGQFLLDGAAGGTPQRLLWLAGGADPGAPNNPPEHPGRLALDLPSFATLAHRVTEDYRGHRLATMGVHGEIAAELRAAQLAVLRGTVEVDPLDTHAGLGRLKVAGLLALLDGRADIDVEDWKLAGLVADTSRAVRTWMAGLLAGVERRNGWARTEYAADRAATIEMAVVGARADVRRVAAVMARHVARHDDGDPCTPRCLSRSVASRDRRHHAAALGHAAEVGWIHDGDGQVRPGESRPA